MATGGWIDAAIMLAIVLASAGLGFSEEYRAGNAVEQLRRRVTLKATVLRDGQPQPVPAEEVVPGDVVLLSAGSLIPADGLVLEADDFFVNQAALTGETFPAEKKPGVVPGPAGLPQRTNCVFMGTKGLGVMSERFLSERGGVRLLAGSAPFPPRPSSSPRRV